MRLAVRSRFVLINIVAFFTLIAATTSLIAEPVISPWALCPDSDSISIAQTRAAAEYKSLDLPRSEIGLNYVGGALWTVTLDIAIHGTTALTTSVNGLMVYDIADPENPVLVNQMPLTFCSTYSLSCLDGDVLYIGGYDRLYVLDASDPVNPQLARELGLDGVIWEIEAHDNMLYVGVGRSAYDYNETPAMYIFDITDPSDPVIVGKYESPWDHNDCRTIEIVGDYAYGVNCWDHRVDIINIANKTSPVQVGYLEVTYPNEVLYDRGYLYVVEWYDMLKIYDLSDPVSPVLVDSLEVDYVRTMKMNDNSIFSSQKSGDERGVAVYEVDSPGEIVYRDFLPCRTWQYSVTIDDTLLYFPEATYGFTVADISDPYDMDSVRAYSHPIHYLKEFDVSSDYVYLIDAMSLSGENRDGWFVVDMTDKQNPELVSYHLDSCLNSGVEVHDSLLLISGCRSTRIMSIADPANPVQLSRYPSYQASTSEALIKNDVLYVAYSYYFMTANISVLTNPLPLSEVYVPPVSMGDIILSGNLAYAAGRSPGVETDKSYLVIVDISDPSELVLIDTFMVAHDWGDFLWTVAEMTMRGNYIYFAGGSTGLSVVDVSNRTHPDVVLNIRAAGEMYRDVTIKRNYLFVAHDYAVLVFDVGDPAAPVLVDHIPFMSEPQRVVADGDYLYMTSRWGFYIYELDLPPGICGDANGSNDVDIDDIVWLISFIFAGGDAPDPYESGDANCSGQVDIDDVVYLISYVFIGGGAPCDIDGNSEPDC